MQGQWPLQGATGAEGSTESVPGREVADSLAAPEKISAYVMESILPSKCCTVSGAHGDRWVGWVMESGLPYCHQRLRLICPACSDEVINLGDTCCSGDAPE